MNQLRRLAALLLTAVLLLLAGACAPPADPSQRSAEERVSALPASPDAADQSAFLPTEGDPSPPDTALPDPEGVYTTCGEVALYIHIYGALPGNFITKRDAQQLGWTGGSLEPYAPGKCIGGSRFGNYEGLLPDAPGRIWTECDIDTLGADSRGAKRIVFSNDGLIYYTGDHYASFTRLY